MITPQNIIDITYLHYVLQTNTEGKLYKPFAVKFLDKQRTSYFKELKPIVYNQLEKYYRRKRVDPGFSLPNPDATFSSLAAAMKQTYRSDMTRRNVVWNSFADYLVELEELHISTSNLDKAMFLFDRIHNSIHNTHTPILEKLENGIELLKALDFCFHNRDIRLLKNKASSAVKDMIFTENQSLKNILSVVSEKNTTKVNSTFTLMLESRWGNWHYQLPAKDNKEQLLWDFYTLANINNAKNINFPDRDFDTGEMTAFRTELRPNLDIDIAYDDAKKTITDFLKPDLLDAIYFAVCAEFRHIEDSNSMSTIKSFIGQQGENQHKILEFVREYIRYNKLYLPDRYKKLFITRRDKHGKTKKIRIYQKDKDKEDYIISYKSVVKAQQKTGMTIQEFMEFAGQCFSELTWRHKFGGKKWTDICNGWILLNKAESVTDKMIYIDHAYDLQHNTDTVFNKLRSYYKDGYEWILKALDFKANLKDIYELVAKANPDLQRFAYAYIYDKFGIARDTMEIIRKNKERNTLNKERNMLNDEFDYSKIPNKKNPELYEKLIVATEDGDIKLVKELLLKGADATWHESIALFEAARKGYEDIVKLLIPVSEPIASHSLALRIAAREGHDNVVKLLIPVSEPTHDSSCVLRWAIEGKHKKCVELLIPVSDPEDVETLKPKIQALGIEI